MTLYYMFPCLEEIKIYRPRPLGEGGWISFGCPNYACWPAISAANKLNKSAIFITI